MEENGADIELVELLISWRVINEGVARGCGIKYHPCPPCILQYPIGRTRNRIFNLCGLSGCGEIGIACCTQAFEEEHVGYKAMHISTECIMLPNKCNTYMYSSSL